MALKFEHGTQLSLEGSIGRTPMVLKAVPFLQLLAIRGGFQGDLSQMIKLLFGLKGGNRGRGERAPCSVELRVGLLELRCRRCKALNLEALEITKVLVEPGSGLKVR